MQVLKPVLYPFKVFQRLATHLMSFSKCLKTKIRPLAQTFTHFSVSLRQLIKSIPAFSRPDETTLQLTSSITSFKANWTTDLAKFRPRLSWLKASSTTLLHSKRTLLYILSWFFVFFVVVLFLIDWFPPTHVSNLSSKK